MFCSSSHEKVQPFMDIPWLSVCSKSLIYALFFFLRLTGRKCPQHSHELIPTGAINANIYAIELIYAVWKNPLRAICHDIWILTGNINHHVLGKMHIYWMSAINLNKYKMTGLYKLVCRFWIKSKNNQVSRFDSVEPWNNMKWKGKADSSFILK